MPSNSRSIVRDMGNNAAPQYFNPVSDQYEVLHGSNGVIFAIDNRIVRDAWSGTSGGNKSLSSTCSFFAVSNDGNVDLTFTIGSITMTVKAQEGFADNFAPFNLVSITTTGAFRAYVKG